MDARIKSGHDERGRGDARIPTALHIQPAVGLTHAAATAAVEEHALVRGPHPAVTPERGAIQ
jgi:hypothetical protein